MIDNKRLMNVDLNLLLLLQVLGKEKNTRKAAERLFVTQSAISKGLKKLREQFDNELFISSNKGLEATPFCEEVQLKLPRLLEELTSLYDTHSNNDYASYSGTVSIAINPSLTFPFAELIQNYVQEKLPNASLELVNWSWNTELHIKKQMIHLGINYYPLTLTKHIVQQPIADVKFNLCLSTAHPLLNQEITMENIAKYPLVMNLMPDYIKQQNHVERLLKEANLTPKVALKSDIMSVCLSTLEKTESVMPIHSLIRPSLPSSLTLAEFSPSIEACIPKNQIALYTANSSEQTMISRQLEDDIKAIILSLS
ncbi:LysR family transcriptional regulator [Aliivibrio fischeri]|uniref:LysR family transcriptional regulator n=1 Tax=Aliivibrio fischeri TaxID=668 RepID=UPI0007C53FC2|nr:LysR family transcriptional regulator [Aliivibrio fischeri]